MNSSASSICQYIGLQRDPETAVAYSSPSNHCFHCQVSSIPTMEHQENYCLTGAYANCPVYHQPETTPFPKEFMYVELGQKHHRHHYPLVWQFFILAIAIVVIGFLLWMGYRSLSPSHPPKIVYPTNLVSTKRPSETPTIAPTQTSTNLPALPTSTLQPTIASTQLPPQSHSLELPILVGKQSFIMHRVTEGDQILFLTQQYHTTLKVLEWINQTPPAPLFTGKVIVIAPGMTDIDPSMPPFEPYQVTDKETDILGLAEKLGVDPEKLKYYNNCSDTCRLVSGDWLLLPPRSNLPVPYTATPGPTSTPTGKTHTLEVPFMVGKQQFLMHRVIEGEQVILLIAQQQTTIEVLQEINYKPAVPLWADEVIVIAPGLIVNVDPILPPFEPYQVTDKEISIEDLSLKLGTDLNLLKYYNNCPDGCTLVRGDWLLISHPK